MKHQRLTRRCERQGNNRSTGPRTTALFAACLAVALLFGVGCSDNDEDFPWETFPGPVALNDFGAFYVVPDPLPPGNPGDIIRVQEVFPLAPNSRAWRVLYRSLAMDGRPIAVSGLIAAPAGVRPVGGWDVVSWAHGTKGNNDTCAPSRGPDDPLHHTIIQIAPEILAQGWVAVATDYEGLGTPGGHPYVVAESESRGECDIVRAARHLVGASSRLVLWGRSQGGHAVLSAAERAPNYAPDLQVLGGIAAAPASALALSFIGSVVLGKSYNWFMALGLEAAYDFSIDPFYTPDALAEIRRIEAENTACVGEINQIVEDRGGVGLRPGFPFIPGAFHLLQLVAQSSPARVHTDVPILIIQGTADTVVPKILADMLVPKMCAIGDSVEYRVYEGQSHNDSSALHMPEYIDWTRARFAGEPVTAGCNPRA